MRKFLEGKGDPNVHLREIFAGNPGPKWDVLGVYGQFVLLLNRFFTGSAVDSKETTVGRQSELWGALLRVNRMSWLENDWGENEYLSKNDLTIYIQSHHSAHSFWSSNATYGNLILGNISKYGKICMHGNYSFWFYL